MSKAAPETLRDYEGRPLSAEELRRIPLFQRLMRSRFGAILFGLIMFLSTFPALVLIGPPFLVLLGTGLASPKSFQKAADFICGRWFFVMIVSTYNIVTCRFPFMSQPPKVFLLTYGARY